MGDRLQGKVAVVVGAGTAGEGMGNGKATAILFAREGARVVVADVSRAAAENTAETIRGEGFECLVTETDVADTASVEAMVNRSYEAFGRIDVLHNNVGIIAPGDPVDVQEEAWNRAMSINLGGVLNTCRYVLPYMIEQGSGSIINISSISSIRDLGPAYIAYPTSKAAINQFSKVVASHYGRYGIRCNAILPGFIRTPMVESQVIAALQGNTEGPKTIDEYYAFRAKQIPLRRMGEPGDIANAALFLASDESRYITGIELVVDGGVINQTT